MTDATTVLPPSGRQAEIHHGDSSAIVVAVAGGLRRLVLAGRDVLDGYAEDAMADGARGQTLVPWPNRVKDGCWSWNGEQQQLALTEPAQHNAIHGLVRWVGWDILEHEAAAVTLACTSYPQTGYPWPLDVSVRYVLDGDGLTVTTTIVNRGSSPAPVAAGAHPYISAGTQLVDEAELHLPVDTWLPTGEQQIPTGREPVAGTPYDFRTPRRIGDTRIDYAFTDLHRDADGRFRLRLRDPGSDRATVLWLGESYPFVEVFTGDALPDPARRRQGLGVEPMTAPPNALASGEALVVLDPGAAWRGEWGITAT